MRRRRLKRSPRRTTARSARPQTAASSSSAPDDPTSVYIAYPGQRPGNRGLRPRRGAGPAPRRLRGDQARRRRAPGGPVRSPPRARPELPLPGSDAVLVAWSSPPRTARPLPRLRAPGRDRARSPAARAADRPGRVSRRPRRDRRPHHLERDRADHDPLLDRPRDRRLRAQLSPGATAVPDRWALAAALGIFAVFAAPVVLSGQPTFAGYIKLDDTATWLAFTRPPRWSTATTSRARRPRATRRRSSSTSPTATRSGPSCRSGSATQLVGTDPRLAGPALHGVHGGDARALPLLADRPLVELAALRAPVAFVAAQSALLYGYALWGGIKELAVALALAVLVALCPAPSGRGGDWRAGVTRRGRCAALLGDGRCRRPRLGGPAPRPGRAPASGARPGPGTLMRGPGPGADGRPAGVPACCRRRLYSPTQGGLTSADELGNLVARSASSSTPGIWPAATSASTPARAR